MKLLRSECERAWFFNAKVSNGFLVAGLACFLPGCKETIVVQHKDQRWTVEVPYRTLRSPVPMKISNARLAMII